ncbi:unnamed protein product [Durusdinium trenchii]|uniref:Cyclic nucleotide-binding domain-containing protein n=1 Tax=Durusdinium trenchii TaxID=1381693 RepID=A0ABP0PCS7_9DINO
MSTPGCLSYRHQAFMERALQILEIPPELQRRVWLRQNREDFTRGGLRGGRDWGKGRNGGLRRHLLRDEVDSMGRRMQATTTEVIPIGCIAFNSLFEKKNLSKALENTLLVYLYRQTLVTSPHFRNKDPNYIIAVVNVLEDQVFLPGDYVVRKGEVATSQLGAIKEASNRCIASSNKCIATRNKVRY